MHGPGTGQDGHAGRRRTPAAAKEEKAEAGRGRCRGSRQERGRAAAGQEAPRRRLRENMLQWAIRASGPIGACLLLLSIYFTALVIRLFMEFRVSEAVPAAAGRKARSGDSRQEVSGRLRRLQGQR